MMESHRKANKSASNGSQFPASTFPETFKDFFSMINEDEDQVELVSNVLEDKVIPRYNVRGRNRSSSAKYTNNASLLPSTGLAVRSNSFRLNRNTSNSQTGAATFTPSDFCKHIKYCCLHQNFNSARLDSDTIDRTSRNQDGRMITSLGSQFKFNELNTNSYSNFSDDEKSMKFNKKFSADFHSNSTNIQNKSLQQNYDIFENRKCNCDNCSAELSKDSGDDFVPKLKSTNSSYCLLRHNRNANVGQGRGSERSSSGASNLTYNLSSNSSGIQEKSTESSTLTSSSAVSNRNKMDINRSKSPIFNRRRASITLARTIPNFGAPSQTLTTIPTSPAHNPNDLYRYIKSDEQQRQNTQQWNEQSHNIRPENREKYTRSKSPSNFNRKTIEVSTPAVSKTSVPASRPQRPRTASMPAENRKPRLADTRRSAIHCADVDMEYYRLRSFSITSHGICNLGDSMRSRRSRSINSVTSSNSGRDRNNSTGSQHMDEIKELENAAKGEDKNVAYKIAMLGESGVGKTALTYQFTTSEYICAYDLSLDDDYGQKTVSILLNNQETDLEIIDHPACEMSVEAFCSTYSIDLFVIVYSVVDRKTFKTAERILLYLKENEMMLTRGAILVGNKTDLERQREVTMQAGKKLAKEIGCKFIETSSGLNWQIDELLVGIVAQVKLNPQRIRNLSEKQRNSLCMTVQQKYKGTTDHFTQLRRNERNKSNMKHSVDAARGKSKSGKGSVGNKENVIDDFQDESDDERSSDESDIEKYFNLDEKTPQHVANSGESSTAMNLNKLLNSRRYATPGMSSHVNPFFNNNINNNISNSNNNLSTSSCSTPTSIYPPGTSSISPIQTNKTNKRDSMSYEPTSQSTSKPATPKKSNQSGAESDTSDRCINRFSNRTKLFLTSFLKFKRSLRVKRRNSNSCSDLFVI